MMIRNMLLRLCRLLNVQFGVDLMLLTLLSLPHFLRGYENGGRTLHTRDKDLLG